MDNLLLLVIGMGVVTYIPRMLPMVLLQNIQLPPFWKRFLRYIPYSAIGALIFPGILSSTSSTGSAVAGGIVAVILAYLKVNLIVVVFGGILGAFCWELFLK
ncbi:Branched-chain amino acid transport protein [Desulfotomaculum arcticum]|uniref:Branched-chain amino acid transport protein n=1 Tax=Desulfotruncus arcticus DSM 17038 TaxID=1121424 RepID=A0A1I2TMP4_9FIRM|nr:AzlD domain-containing protein [Desulfotruncus arcticus]SFG66083.1 Branched-chain amino acid transport protein [Desulfotomaculum arcticum] [Desulfotruncus arcticus DSM 17038]